MFGHELLRSNSAMIEGDHRVFTADLSTGFLEPIEPFTINPEYVAGGFLTYQLRNDGGKLVVRPIDENTGQFTGQPVDVFDEGREAVWSRYSISSNGDLLFTVDSRSSSARASLWVVDLKKRSSSRLNITVPDELEPGMPSLSKDDSKILFRAAGRGRGDIYEFDRDDSFQYQISTELSSYALAYDPVDGARLYSRTASTGRREIVRLDPGPPTGASPTLIRDNGNDIALSDDGRWMAYSTRAHGYALDTLRNLVIKIIPIARPFRIFTWRVWNHESGQS